MDVGSGSGYLVEFFKVFAKESFGVEPSRLGEKAYIVRDIADLPKDKKFDCIMIHGVLEHIFDPVDMLKKIKNISNPGALLFAGFPRGESYKARIQKNNWSMMRPVGHLHYFSAKSVETMFNKAGWKVIKRRPARLGDMNAWQILKWFPLKEKRLLYRIFKSLIVGQLLLGKDQWEVKAVA